MTEKTKKTPYKKIGVALFIVLNVGLLLWAGLSDFGSEPEGDPAPFRWGFLIPAFLCFFGAIAADIFKYWVQMRSLCGRVNLGTAIRTVILGRYYTCVTPGGLGGQPAQIVYLVKHGYPGDTGTIMPLAAYMSGQFAFILLFLLLVPFAGRLYLSAGIRASAYVGLFFFALLPALILLFTFLPHQTEGLIGGLIGFLFQVRIIKNKEEALSKVHEQVYKYTDCLKRLLKNGKLCLQLMGLSLLYHLCVCSIPYFAILTFGGEIGFFACLITALALTAAISVMPTPGNAGVAEGSFTAVFGVLSGRAAVYAMLVWRFLQFYSFVLAGFFVYLVRFLRRKRGAQPGKGEELHAGNDHP